ncbi:hypothetical protein [Aquimarina agarivorans]|uniref:hypothetical protein n=1 Tax=Aquimarina agarivorans TaxID=980584 RepID=UPI000248EB08|nr:hypothetical protein [Aquimarina agarivorans]
MITILLLGYLNRLIISILLLTSFFTNSQNFEACTLAPTLFTVQNTLKPTCNSSNGVVVVEIKRGMAPFNLLVTDKITNSTVINETDIKINSFGLNSFSPGKYEFKITSANGCTSTQALNIISSSITLGVVKDETINCNPKEERNLVYGFSSQSFFLERFHYLK